MTDDASGIPKEERSCVVAVYETDEQARLGFDALREEGIAEERITVVGAGETEDAAGAFEAESPTAKGAARGALLGGVVGVAVTVLVPGAGVVYASGLFAAAAIGGVTGALAGGGLGILAEVGVPTASLKDYEEDLMGGRYLVVVHGDAADAERARAVLDMTDTEELDLFL
jgi:hypothetical protein